MQPTYDPEHGELKHVIGHLGSLEAEMIVSDLQDLKIPALVRPQRVAAVHPETEEEIFIETETFEILVPEAFAQITEEVLDATHMQSEGDAAHDEILQELNSPAALPEEAAFETAPLLRNSNEVGRYMLRVFVVLIVVGFVSAVWKLFR